MVCTPGRRHGVGLTCAILLLAAGAVRIADAQMRVSNETMLHDMLLL